MKLRIHTFILMCDTYCRITASAFDCYVVSDFKIDVGRETEKSWILCIDMQCHSLSCFVSATNMQLIYKKVFQGKKKNTVKYTD